MCGSPADGPCKFVKPAPSSRGGGTAVSLGFESGAVTTSGLLAVGAGKVTR